MSCGTRQRRKTVRDSESDPFRPDADFTAPHATPPASDEQDWIAFLLDPDRNTATADQTRRTLVVVPIGYSTATHALRPHVAAASSLPSPVDVAAYLSAFTTLSSRVAPELPIVDWQPATRRALAVLLPGDVLVRVRARAMPDGEFNVQLQVHDLLDALLEYVELQGDAFSVVGLTPYDLHEDGQLVCGRAFGGSRVACVSLARYHPDLAEREWPASLGSSVRGGPLLAAARAAAAAAEARASATPTMAWLASVALTASHEVGHCMGLDHCTAYACFMGELDGQPPYACPSCLRKMLTTAAGEDGAAGAVVEHYRRLALFCGTRGRCDVPLWAALHAWAGGRAESLSLACSRDLAA
jgi:archaemetzincin